jgi:surface antigen
MLNSHHFDTGLSGLYRGVACVCLCAVCAAPVEAQTDANAPGDTQPTCRLVAGQAEIDGVMQQITGRACLQPDGTWQIVEDDAGAQYLADGPVYYYDPWYWGPPVVFAAGVSFVFIDRFHHHHHMDHVHYVHGVSGMGGHGVWHGGASSMHMWSGVSHGSGGGMHR